MTEEDRVDISEEVNPPVPAHSQPPPTHAPPPPTPAGVPPAYSGAPSTHLPPPTSSGAPLPRVSLASSTSDDHARIAALEGTVLSAPPPVSMPAPAAVYTVPPPMVFPASSVPTPAHLQAAGLPPYPSSQPHISLPYQAPPPINTTFLEPSTPTHVAQFASPTHFLPEVDVEQERRLKRMEETIRTLQANETRPDARYGDCSLFPGMLLPSKVKIPEFRTYEGTTDPDTISAITKERCYILDKLRAPTLCCPRLHLAGAAIPTLTPIARRPSLRIYPTASPSIPTLIFGNSSVGSEGPTSIGSTGWCSTIATTQTVPVFAGPAFPHLPTTPCKQQNRNDSARPQLRPNHPGSEQAIICALEEGKSEQSGPSPFVIEYVPTEVTVGFTGIGTSPTPFVIDIPTREPCLNDKVPWTYEGGVGNLERQFSVMGVTRSGRLYGNPAAADKGKAPAVEIEAIPGAPPTLPKKVTEEEAEAFMKIIKAILKGTPPDRIEETVSSIFSNTISFSNDELPSEGCTHSRALHIVCKCNNYVIGRVMIDNGSALNVCPVTTLKQMNVDLNRVRPSKTAVRAFDGSRREVNGEIDLLIDVGPCSFSITFQVLDIPNAFSLLLGRPWLHSASAVPSSLH
ncbi:hypothetical protein CRG98_006427 [Punica granatum]|uniref:Uncharacterized protein n=1 Tax=Punica granatum TaxID=22663 RepID=A0A2I0KXH4_PUNGR|nr:hypothetical protein CRG98_006427 [Punica granatum]